MGLKKSGILVIGIILLSILIPIICLHRDISFDTKKNKRSHISDKVWNERIIKAFNNLQSPDSFKRDSAAELIKAEFVNKGSFATILAFNELLIECHNFETSVVLWNTVLEKELLGIQDQFYLDANLQCSFYRWQLITEKNVCTRNSAIYALGILKDRMSVPYLINLACAEGDSNCDAVVALGHIGDERALKPLINIITSRTPVDCITSACLSLGLIGNKSVIPILEDEVHRFDLSTFTYALKALVLLGAKPKAGTIKLQNLHNNHANISMAPGIIDEICILVLQGKKEELGKLIQQVSSDSDNAPYIARFLTMIGNLDLVDWLFVDDKFGGVGTSELHWLMINFFPEFPARDTPFRKEAIRQKYENEIRSWLDKNRNILSWDEDKREYIVSVNR